MPRDLKISPKTHAEIKRRAKRCGMGINRMADSILFSWCNGEVFFLPRSLPKGKASESKNPGKAE